MITRKANLLLILFSLIGGGIGYVIGELMLWQWEGQLHPTLLMGIYFAQFSFFVVIMCFAAEIISPVLNGRGWRQKYVGDGWKLLLPATLVLFFAAGLLFQFIYGLTFTTQRPADDFVLVIDVSGSMNGTDPDSLSLKAANSFVQQMGDQQQASVILFNDNPHLLTPLSAMTAEAKKQADTQINDISNRDGGTDIGLALEEAAKQLSAAAATRQSAVILLSDGYSDLAIDEVLKPFTDHKITVHSIGMQRFSDSGSKLLRKIAHHTGGTFHNVQHANGISSVMNKIYVNQYDSHLMGDRQGVIKDSVVKAVLRVLFIALLGGLLGLALGIVFDNRHLAKSFSIGSVIAGIMAGLIVELGLKGSMDPAVLRAIADIVLASVLALSTVLIGFKPPDTWAGFRRPGADAFSSIRAGGKEKPLQGGKFGL